MRRTTAALVLVLSPLLLAGCGDKETDAGKDTAPTSAPEEATTAAAPEKTTASMAEFCAAQKELIGQTMAATSGKVDAAKLKAAYAEIDEMGLPEDAPADVEDGYEISMAQADKIVWDTMAKDPLGYLGTLGKGVSAEDTDKATTYGQWVVKECKITG